MLAVAVAALAVSLPPVKAQAEPIAGIPVEVVVEASQVLTSPENGRLLRLPQAAGQRFRRGEVLVAVECEAQLRQDAAWQALALANASPAPQRGKHPDVAMAAEQQARAENAYDAARQATATCRTRAPYDGTVLRVLAAPSSPVTAGQPLIEIVPDAGWRVRGHTDLGSRLHIGSRLRLALDPQAAHTQAAVVTSVASQGASGPVAFQARLIEAVGTLWPGMKGMAEVVLPAGFDRLAAAASH